MKRIGNLYDSLLDREHIKEVIVLAAKGKKKRNEVKRVLANIDFYTDKIYEMLDGGGIYLYLSHRKTIIEKGKKRELTISPFFPNRILDYLMVEAIKPYIRKSMYQYCIGNVDKKGMSYGKRAIAKKYKKYKYYVKLDIHHFYPSTSSENLMAFLERRIKDDRFLHLCRTLICSEDCLPIGSYYSQWLSNWFLEDLDHYIKEVLRVPFYVRYVDDMLLMGNNRRKLLRAMYGIQAKLKSKGLCLKRFEQAYTVEQRPIDFLGFRFRAKGIYLRTRNYKRINRKTRALHRKKHICRSMAQSLLSYVGWLKQIKIGYLYYIKKIKPYIKIGTLKRIVSNYYRARQFQLFAKEKFCEYLI